MQRRAPIFNKQFACIVDFERLEMAAIISSYLSEPGTYLPIFEFPGVGEGKQHREGEFSDGHDPGRQRAEQFAVLVNNALVRLQGCNYIVLAGLSEEQKSYLYFLHYYTVITIDDTANISFLLSPFRANIGDVLFCRSDQVLLGLYLSLRRGAILQLDEFAEYIEPVYSPSDDIVVVEAEPFASAIVGVQYACAVEAAFMRVSGITKEELTSIQPLIDGWRSGQSSDLEDVRDLVFSRVGQLDFSRYSSATFFTAGIPYSLVLENCTPMCHVHSLYRPDFFVFNAIWQHHGPAEKAAVFFSPMEFPDEETQVVINRLKDAALYTRPLLGKDAILHNLDMHVREFPFDILHICSHGGEVDGYEFKEQFTDRDGSAHTVEFDEVLGFGIVLGTDKVRVSRKWIPRKLDGYIWGSKALKSLGLLPHVYSDMHNYVRKRLQERAAHVGVPKRSIAGSSAIKCADNIYQAMFHSIAAHGSPVVFNNSCWSAFGISECFLVGGSRGYIGTLWAVSNEVAISVAESFYLNLFQDSVMDALYEAAQKALGSSSAHIYHYWGLPFVRLRPCGDSELSRYNVFLEHIEGLKGWQRHAAQAVQEETREEAKRLYRWHGEQLLRYFRAEDMKALRETLAKKGLISAASEIS
jgi:hypothetical protein